MLSTVKIFEILPKRNGYGVISESFALNWYWSDSFISMCWLNIVYTENNNA